MPATTTQIVGATLAAAEMALMQRDMLRQIEEERRRNAELERRLDEQRRDGGGGGGRKPRREPADGTLMPGRCLWHRCEAPSISRRTRLVDGKREGDGYWACSNACGKTVVHEACLEELVCSMRSQAPDRIACASCGGELFVHSEARAWQAVRETLAELAGPDLVRWLLWSLFFPSATLYAAWFAYLWTSWSLVLFLFELPIAAAVWRRRAPAKALAVFAIAAFWVWMCTPIEPDYAVNSFVRERGPGAAIAWSDFNRWRFGWVEPLDATAGSSWAALSAPVRWYPPLVDALVFNDPPRLAVWTWSMRTLYYLSPILSSMIGAGMLRWAWCVAVRVLAWGGVDVDAWFARKRKRFERRPRVLRTRDGESRE